RVGEHDLVIQCACQAGDGGADAPAAADDQENRFGHVVPRAAVYFATEAFISGGGYSAASYIRRASSSVTSRRLRSRSRVTDMAAAAMPGMALVLMPWLERPALMPHWREISAMRSIPALASAMSSPLRAMPSASATSA